MANSGGIRTLKPLNRQKIWHGWLQRYHPACRNLKWLPQLGHPDTQVKYCVVVCDPVFTCILRRNCRTDFYAVWFMLLPGYCTLRAIKLLSISPIFTPKTCPTGVWIGIFKPNLHNIETHMSSKLHCNSNQILHSDMFSRFDRTLACERRTNTQITQGYSIYRASIALRGKRQCFEQHPPGSRLLFHMVL